jgi:hypothetical protein
MQSLIFKDLRRLLLSSPSLYEELWVELSPEIPARLNLNRSVWRVPYLNGYQLFVTVHLGRMKSEPVDISQQHS